MSKKKIPGVGKLWPATIFVSKRFIGRQLHLFAYILSMTAFKL